MYCGESTWPSTTNAVTAARPSSVSRRTSPPRAASATIEQQRAREQRGEQRRDRVGRPAGEAVAT